MSDIEQEYLSNKRALLNAPGTKLSSIYYSNINSTVDLVQQTFSTGKYSQSLPSLLFGSSVQLQIPIGSFLGECYLRLVLPNTIANQSLCRGWGFATIAKVEYLWGSSNTPFQTIFGQTLLQTNFVSCETSEKGSEMFRLAGEEMLIPYVSKNFGEDVPLVEGTILLPFPWSSMSSLVSKLPFDTTLLNNVITIALTFNNSDAFYSGTGARPSGFVSGTLSTRQGDLANQKNSLRDMMVNNSNMFVPYPFYYHQSESPNLFTGIVKSSGLRNIVRIQNFYAADLLSIYFVVVRTSRLSSNNNSIAQPFAFEELTDVSLTLNGQIIYNAPGRQHKLLSMRDRFGGAYFQNSLIGLGSGGSVFASSPIDSYPIFIDFSRIRSSVFSNHFSNVERYAANTMNLQFNTQLATETYQLYATYVYNSINEIQNSQTNIYTA